VSIGSYIGWSTSVQVVSRLTAKQWNASEHYILSEYYSLCTAQCAGRATLQMCALEQKFDSPSIKGSGVSLIQLSVGSL